MRKTHHVFCAKFHFSWCVQTCISYIYHIFVISQPIYIIKVSFWSYKSALLSFLYSAQNQSCILRNSLHFSLQHLISIISLPFLNQFTWSRYHFKATNQSYYFFYIVHKITHVFCPFLSIYICSHATKTTWNNAQDHISVLCIVCLYSRNAQNTSVLLCISKYINPDATYTNNAQNHTCLLRISTTSISNAQNTCVVLCTTSSMSNIVS